MRARGFSLVETMVAAVLLTGGLLALIAAMRSMERLDAIGRRMGEAADALASQAAHARTACPPAAGNVRSAAVVASWTAGGISRSDSVDASWWCGRAP